MPLRKIESLRAHEGNSKSMPSGDTGYGACFFTLCALTFDCMGLMVLIPFVALARVYFHCHWIFDTVVGACIGIAFASISYNFMPYIAQAM